MADMGRKSKDAIPAGTVDERAPAGSLARVLEDVSRYMDASDMPMVPYGVANNDLASTDNMNIAPSKLFEDNGKKINVVRYLAERAKHTAFPVSSETLYVSLEDFFTFCATFHVPPTLGCFAVWNGVSVQRVNQVERDRNDPRSEAIKVCKDLIRGFLEMAAMDNAVNPIVYFHQNKVYFGAVENQQVTVRVEDNTSEITDEEYRERVVQLVEGSDGVYREA